MQEAIRKTLDRIKQEKITPTAGWKISLYNYGFWGLFLFMMVMGSLTVAMIVHFTYDLDWDVYGILESGRGQLVLSAIPLLWFLLLLIFLILSFVNLRSTYNGYKYESAKVLGVLGGVSVGMGMFLFSIRTQERVSQMVTYYMPQYSHMVNKNEEFWCQPEIGLLGGQIILVTEKGIDLRDFEGQRWLVVSDRNTVVKPKVILRRAARIKVIGKEEDNEESRAVFRAKEIRPWEARTEVLERDEQEDSYEDD